MRHSKRGIIGYNIRLTPRSKKNRLNPTPCEDILWRECLFKKKLKGYRFVRQKPIDNFILDFYCSKLLLAIEVDGKYHERQKEYDEQRTIVLNSYGIKVVRINNCDIVANLNSVRRSLQQTVIERKNTLPLLRGRDGVRVQILPPLVKGEGRGEG